MRYFLLALCVLLFPHRAPAMEYGKVFGAEHYRLANGMQIVVIPNRRAPVVTHMVWYKAGSADEEQGKSGIAHFLEHLMFKGSPVAGGKQLAPGQFSEEIRRLGGQENAFTGADYTAYHESAASMHLEALMRMEAGRMRGLNPPPGEVEAERSVVIEERRQRTDNDPRGAFRERMAAALYPDHPYGIPVIGWPDEMRTLNWPDAKTFYDRWYGPDNAILVVAGDVSGSQVLELAEKIYGPLQPVSPPERSREARPENRPGSEGGVVEMRHPGIRQPLFQMAFRVPGYRQDPEASLALQVLEEIAGGGPSSRLYRALVMERGLATDAGLAYDATVLDDAVLWLYAVPVPGVGMKAVEAALKEELRKLAEAAVTPEEMSDAISRLQAESVYARDSLEGPAMIFGEALAAGLTVDDVEYWPRRIGQVTAARIRDTVREYLDFEDRESGFVTGILLPQEAG